MRRTDAGPMTGACRARPGSHGRRGGFRESAFQFRKASPSMRMRFERARSFQPCAGRIRRAALCVAHKIPSRSPQRRCGRSLSVCSSVPEGGSEGVALPSGVDKCLPRRTQKNWRSPRLFFAPAAFGEEAAAGGLSRTLARAFLQKKYGKKEGCASVLSCRTSCVRLMPL